MGSEDRHDHRPLAGVGGGPEQKQWRGSNAATRGRRSRACPADPKRRRPDPVCGCPDVGTVAADQGAAAGSGSAASGHRERGCLLPPTRPQRPHSGLSGSSVATCGCRRSSGRPRTRTGRRCRWRILTGTGPTRFDRGDHCTRRWPSTRPGWPRNVHFRSRSECCDESAPRSAAWAARRRDPYLRDRRGVIPSRLPIRRSSSKRPRARTNAPAGCSVWHVGVVVSANGRSCLHLPNIAPPVRRAGLTARLPGSVETEVLGVDRFPGLGHFLSALFPKLWRCCQPRCCKSRGPGSGMI